MPNIHCNDYPYGIHDVRVKKAAQQILQVSIDAGLTWNEFEKAIEKVKSISYLSDSNSSSDNDTK